MKHQEPSPASHGLQGGSAELGSIRLLAGFVPPPEGWWLMGGC